VIDAYSGADATERAGPPTIHPVPPDARRVALLTGGDDKSYALGLTRALTAAGVLVDFVGSDALEAVELRENPRVRFLNLRGSQRTDVSLFEKALRIGSYYLKLLVYTARLPRRTLLHILWNNKFEWLDRTLLMYWYRAFGHRVVLTAHNVNAARRDGRDSWMNRLTLREQYRLCSHVFVHTSKMRDELIAEFGVAPPKISVIPFGLNDTAPRTGLTRAAARARLHLDSTARVILFFGQIAPYKGLEYLVRALPQLAGRVPQCVVLIAGKTKAGHESYWREVSDQIARLPASVSIVTRIEHIPDEDIELFFEAADVLALPYVNIFQSGVPFLAYSFGLPVVASDVGSLAEDIVDGRTGYVCRPSDPEHLADCVARFFEGDLYLDAARARADIVQFARTRYSWTEVARVTRAAYDGVGAI
jgi:glycosyltransferase involved in cell wall biosynthesis